MVTRAPVAHSPATRPARPIRRAQGAAYAVTVSITTLGDVMLAPILGGASQRMVCRSSLLWSHWERCSFCCRRPDRLPRKFARLAAVASEIQYRVKMLNLQPKVKVAVSFYQVVTVLDSTYSVEMPQVFKDFMHTFNVVGFKWQDIVAPDGCVATGFIGKLVNTAMFPVSILIIALVSVHRAKDLETPR